MVQWIRSGHIDLISLLLWHFSRPLCPKEMKRISLLLLSWEKKWRDLSLRLQWRRQQWWGEFNIDEGDDRDGRKAWRHYWNVMPTVGQWSICCRWRRGGRVRQQRWWWRRFGAATASCLLQAEKREGNGNSRLSSARWWYQSAVSSSLQKHPFSLISFLIFFSNSFFDLSASSFFLSANGNGFLFFWDRGFRWRAVWEFCVGNLVIFVNWTRIAELSCEDWWEKGFGQGVWWLSKVRLCWSGPKRVQVMWVGPDWGSGWGLGA